MVAIYCYMEREKVLKMPGGANENKCGIYKNKSCSSVIKDHRRSIQVFFKDYSAFMELDGYSYNVSTISGRSIYFIYLEQCMSLW